MEMRKAVRICIKLDENDNKLLKNAACDMNVSKSNLIRKLIKDFLRKGVKR